MSDLAENLSALRPLRDDVSYTGPPDHMDGAPVPSMSGAWRNVPAADRARILHAVADDIGARRCGLPMTGSRV